MGALHGRVSGDKALPRVHSSSSLRGEWGVEGNGYGVCNRVSAPASANCGEWLVAERECASGVDSHFGQCVSLVVAETRMFPVSSRYARMLCHVPLDVSKVDRMAPVVGAPQVVECVQYISDVWPKRGANRAVELVLVVC